MHKFKKYENKYTLCLYASSKTSLANYWRLC